MANANGTPIWFELNAADANAAQAFYTAVAPWSVAPSPMAEHGGYRIASAPDGDGIAGIMTPPPGAPAGSGWSIYFAVDDTDAFARKVGDAGGSVHFGPMDIPHVGRFAMCTDPQGVDFTIMTGFSAENSRAFVQMEDGSGLGHAVWVELATPDPDAAFAFYGALFGYEKAGAMPMGDMGDYAFIAAGDLRPGAIMPSTTTNAPARWNWYVEVADIDAAVATVRSRGGTVLWEPTEIPGGSFSANVADPQGNQIGLVGPRKAA